jgi:phosphopantothenoylcysteine decarboxylase / phosphopantothenate---cysteine ligase
MTPLNILITAGPTREAIDPVRFLSNHSTGSMGYTIARKAQNAGHRVTLISGPVALKPPARVQTIDTQTAREMFQQIKRHIKNKDCLIMAAAISDFRPAVYSTRKIKRFQNPGVMRLKESPDILSWVGKHRGRLIVAGFCMETENLVKRAKEKLKSKKTDFMVANSITKSVAPFGDGPTNVVILDADNKLLRLNNVSKGKVAGILLDKIEKLWYKKHSVRNV